MNTAIGGRVSAVMLGNAVGPATFGGFALSAIAEETTAPAAIATNSTIRAARSQVRCVSGFGMVLLLPLGSDTQ